MRIILFLLLLNFTTALGAAPKKIFFVYEVKPNPPFYLGKDSIDWKKPGITLEVLKSLENKLNIEINFRRRPWARGLEEVRTNKSDGIFHASFKKTRQKIGVYPMKDGKPDTSRQIMTQAYFLYKRKDSPLQWDGKTFSYLNGAIGAIIQYAIVEDLRKMKLEVDEVPTQLSNLKKLVSGHVAGVAGLETMNDLHIKAYPKEFKDIIKVFPPIKRKPYYLMFSHKFVTDNPELAEAIWNTIREIREKGQYDNIARKYF